MRHLHGMSFREYLKLVHKIDVPVYSLEEILAGKAQPKALPHPLPLFRQYLRDGYYPFSLEGDFQERMQNVIRQTMESSSRVSDFSVGEYTFEVGGKKKGKKQISEVANGYVVRDEIEYAANQIIPLWAFGLMY